MHSDSDGIPRNSDTSALKSSSWDCLTRSFPQGLLVHQAPTMFAETCCRAFPMTISIRCRHPMNKPEAPRRAATGSALRILMSNPLETASHRHTETNIGRNAPVSFPKRCNCHSYFPARWTRSVPRTAFRFASVRCRVVNHPHTTFLETGDDQSQALPLPESPVHYTEERKYHYAEEAC